MKKILHIAPWIGVMGILLVPVFIHNPYYLHLVETILIYAILLFGLDIVVGYTGQVSLGHAGLFGIGSYTTGVLLLKLGLPFYLTIPASILLTAGFGALLALPALRVTGPYLAMVTLAFGTIIQILINEMSFLTEGPMGIKVSKPVIFGAKLTETGHYYFVAVMMLLAMLCVHRILKSYLGRAFQALRDSPIASDCMGVSVYRYKVLAFVISAALAGLAGSLYAYSEEYISPNTYNFELTILFLLAVIMGGRKSRTGSLLGALIVVMLPSLLADIELFRKIATGAACLGVIFLITALFRVRTVLRGMLVPVIALIGMALFAYKLESITDWRLTIFGLMTLFVVYYLQDGIVGFVMSISGSRVTHVISHAGAMEGQNAVQFHGNQTDRNILTADQIVMQFGGLKALNRVDLRIEKGTVHGLIGPNGSGKSTMMNVLTGIYFPTDGKVTYVGRLISGMTPSAIALSGIARTFQNVQLFGEMTATENILVGLHHTFGSSLWDILVASRSDREHEASARQRAASILRFVGLHDLADEEARNLPYGKQRLLEIGRALALNPGLLLLDEPAAGLTAPDIKELTNIIKKIKESGVTIILIEHHMDVVMSVCDIVTVLDFGQKIAEGTPAEIQQDARVIEAYLGGSQANSAEEITAAGEKC